MPPQSDTHRARLTLAVLLTAATLTIMAGAVISPVIAVITTALDIRGTVAGFIITTHALFIALFSPLFGRAIEAYGPKRPFAIGLVAFGFAGGAGLVLDSFWALIISRALLGIALAAFYSALTVLILDLYAEDERNRIMGYRASANSIGGITWPLVGGLLGSLSWHYAFSAYLIGIPLGVLAIVAIPKSQSWHRTAADTAHPHHRGEASAAALWPALRARPLILQLYTLMFATNLFLYAIVVFAPQRLAALGVTLPFTISLFITAMTAAAGVTAFIYGWLKRRAAYATIILAALAIWSVGYGSMALLDSVTAIVVGVVCFGAGQGVVMPTIMLWVGELAPGSHRARITSLIGTAGFLGQFLTPLLFAPVVAQYGIPAVYLTIALCCMAALALTLLQFRKRTHAARYQTRPD